MAVFYAYDRYVCEDGLKSKINRNLTKMVTNEAVYKTKARYILFEPI